MELWRKIQKTNFTKIEDLAAFLEIDPKRIATSSFPLNFPRRLAEKVEKGSLDDPILQQFLPSHYESMETAGFTASPISDHLFQKSPLLLQKYQGRVLLMPTSACAMHCRFCFRQNYPYETEKDFTKELQLIKEDPSIYEVILSGGDPLSLSDEKLSRLVKDLEKIPHLKLLRFHTRFPIGIPERITPAFTNILKETSLQPIFILHINHPKEIDDLLLTSLKKLPVPIMTQTVLLRGINDDTTTLKTLFLTLVSNGIIPYYLHQLDRITQAAHFDVSIKKGKEIIKALRSILPGYAVPTYVQEIPHQDSKTLI
ncbi:MAG: KamA family radical SAM protein [Chlamydiia bacterium]|nr:KamA family radical SAM protein [Chlamydiia bacterium]